MSFLKKAVIAGICITPLAISACGSDKGDSKAEAPTSSASSVSAVVEQTTTSSVVTSDAVPTSEASPEIEAPPAPEGEPANPPALNLENPIQVEQLAPVEGQVASDADRAAIDSLVRSFTYAPTVRQYMANMINNTCSRVIEANGGAGVYDLNQVADLPMESFPGYQAAKPTVDSVDDVRVKGDEASASVTSTSGGKTETGVMRFHKEGGSWKLCN